MAIAPALGMPYRYGHTVYVNIANMELASMAYSSSSVGIGIGTVWG